MVKHHKKEKIDFECEYCGKEFKTVEEVEEHELNCKKRPLRIRGNIKTRFGVWEGFKFGIGLWLAALFIGIMTFLILVALGIGQSSKKYYCKQHC